jgi:hypothetical protein
VSYYDADANERIQELEEELEQARQERDEALRAMEGYTPPATYTPPRRW